MELGIHRDEWKRLTQCRLDDAAVLLRNERYDASYYLAGYAVECALKARIVSVLEGYFPPRQGLYIHDLEKLLEAARLEKVFVDKSKMDAQFADQWETVKDWSEESRYDTQDRRAAGDMLKAAQGVVECIRKYW